MLNRPISLSLLASRNVIIENQFVSVCSGLQLKCDAHGSLRTAAKQLSANAEDLCDISFVSR